MISFISIPTSYHTVPTKNTNGKGAQYLNIKCIYIIIAKRKSKVTVVMEDHYFYYTFFVSCKIFL